jgi:hypothetical protein
VRPAKWANTLHGNDHRGKSKQRNGGELTQARAQRAGDEAGMHNPCNIEVDFYFARAND